MSQTTLLVANPGSRSGDDALGPARKRLESQGKVDSVRPERPVDLPELLRRRGRRFDRVVLAGGDGTVNLALDALLELEKPFGLLPLGTANDLARSLGIPQSPERALEVILEGRRRRIDVARINDVSFVNAIGIGLGPRMTREMDAESKARFGVAAYARGVLRALRRQPVFRARIESDERVRQGDFVQITVANGIHYGGGMTVAYDAKIDDGLLDILLVPRQSRWSLLGNALRFRKGLTRNADRLRHWRSASVRIETAEAMPVTADGEFLTETPADCRVLSRGLQVFAPRR